MTIGKPCFGDAVWRRMMKKLKVKYILCGVAMSMLVGCSAATGGDGAQAPEQAGTEQTDAASLKQAGLGGLALLYDDSVWTYDESRGSDSSLAFTAQDGSLLGISCSREGFYQHPLDMINVSRQLSAGYTNFEDVEEPVQVMVQDDEWYEWIYQYEENGVKTMALQRFYGKNYYAYTISYIAEEKSFEANRSEALKVMNSAVMSVPDNEEAEKKAQEFLAGEWDLGDAGYLVMRDDGTYTWYMDSSKDEKNMHKGTYGGDVRNDALGFEEGKGLYFVLFPEVLYTDGEEGKTSGVKYDYGVSLEQNGDGGYDMINANTFAMYSMLRMD